MFGLLAEELLLLAIHEEKGSFPVATATRLPYCLAGSLLMDLALRKRIIIEQKELRVLERRPTGHPILDEVLKMIANQEKVKSPYFWISKIGRKIKPVRIRLWTALLIREY